MSKKQIRRHFSKPLAKRELKRIYRQPFFRLALLAIIISLVASWAIHIHRFESFAARWDPHRKTHPNPFGAPGESTTFGTWRAPENGSVETNNPVSVQHGQPMGKVYNIEGYALPWHWYDEAPIKLLRLSLFLFGLFLPCLLMAFSWSAESSPSNREQLALTRISVREILFAKCEIWIIISLLFLMSNFLIDSLVHLYVAVFYDWRSLIYQLHFSTPHRYHWDGVLQVIFNAEVYREGIKLWWSVGITGLVLIVAGLTTLLILRFFNALPCFLAALIIGILIGYIAFWPTSAVWWYLLFTPDYVSTPFIKQLSLGPTWAAMLMLYLIALLIWWLVYKKAKQLYFAK